MSAGTVRKLAAELVEDGGAAAAGPEFFRCPPYLRAEGVTHTLVIGGGAVALPVIVRAIPGGHGVDGVSPYGYPGGSCGDEPPHVDQVDFSGTGLVSLFLRERLGEPVLRGAEERGSVLLHDPSMPRAVQRRTATKVRSNERRGYRCVSVPAAAVDEGLLHAFAVIYEQTMTRAQASDRYFFGVDYLRACLSAERSWLVAVHGPSGDLAAAALLVVSDRHLHYFLGGTGDAHREASPAKNMMLGMLDLAEELGIPLNLGGGLTPGDSLHVFKSGFTNVQDVFRTHSVVVDAVAYAELSGGVGSPDSYFPAYRWSAG